MQRHTRQGCEECLRAAFCKSSAIDLTEASSHGACLAVRCPCARGLSLLLVAIAKIDQRSSARINALALDELRTCLRKVARDHERTRFLEELLGHRRIASCCCGARCWRWRWRWLRPALTHRSEQVCSEHADTTESA